MVNQNNCCNNATKNYLTDFHAILDEMIREMTSAKLTDSISYNFIVQMIPHHRAAIEMSRNILKYTKNKPLERIASNIVTEQTKSIENMRKIQDVCKGCKNSEQDLRHYRYSMNEIMQNMFSKMNNARTTCRLDCDFMREMIPHHMGAVEMSETTLQYSICPELKPILHTIILSQRRGIMQMQRLLSHIGCPVE